MGDYLQNIQKDESKFEILDAKKSEDHNNYTTSINEDTDQYKKEYPTKKTFFSTISYANK